MTVQPMKRAITAVAIVRKTNLGELEFIIDDVLPDLKTPASRLVQLVEKHAPSLTVIVDFRGHGNHKVLVRGQHIKDWFETPGRCLTDELLGYVYAGWDDTMYVNCSKGPLTEPAQANMASLGLVVLKPIGDISLRAGKLVMTGNQASPICDFVAWANANPPSEKNGNDGLLSAMYAGPGTKENSPPGPDMNMFARCILRSQHDAFNTLHTLLEKYLDSMTPKCDGAPWPTQSNGTHGSLAPREADSSVPELSQQNEDALCSLLLDRFEQSARDHFDFLMQQFHVLARPALLRRVVRELVASIHRNDARLRAQLELLIPDASHATLTQLLTHLLT